MTNGGVVHVGTDLGHREPYRRAGNASTGILTLSEHSAFVENLHFVGNFSGEMITIHRQNGMGAISLQHS